MNETEQETLDLRLDSEDAESGRAPLQQALLTTQTSCISVAVSDTELSQELARGSSQESAEDQSCSEKALRASDPVSENAAVKPSSSSASSSASSITSAPFDQHETVTNCDDSLSDEARTESPEPPNEHSELNEMDTTFMRGESDTLLASKPQPDRIENNAQTLRCTDDAEPRWQETIPSPKCGSDAEGDFDETDDHNTELQQAMAADQEGEEEGGEREEEGEEEGGEREEEEGEEEEESAFDKGPEISLPYKEPEQLSLREFLARRRSKRSSAQRPNTEQQACSPIVKLTDDSDPSSSAGQAADEQPKRKSKLREEILKAASKVTPKLSRSNIITTTPVDELIQKAVSMHCVKLSPSETSKTKKTTTSVPGAQLLELKASLKGQIEEQRKKSRRERTKRILGETLERDDEEEEGDYTTDDDDDDDDDKDFDDEEALLGKVAQVSDNEQDEVENNPRKPSEVFDNEASESVEHEDTGAINQLDEDSDIEELTERKKTQKNKKKKKNAIQDSDDDGDGDGDHDADDDSEEDLELKIQDHDEEDDDDDDDNGGDDDDDDASFMHLSQTQIPRTDQRQQKTSLDLYMDNDDAADVDEDLVALCSGRFVSQKNDAPKQKSNGAITNHRDDDNDDNDEVELCADESETGEDEVARKDDELDDELDDEHDDEHDDELGRQVNGKIKQAKSGTDFFEGEAELSGSDVGSDDEDDNDGMTEAEKAKLLRELISENPGISEEALHEQVTRLHFKQMLDDDRKDIRLMKEMLLADGELHSDGAGRERSFKWTNLSNDFVGGRDNASDDSEHEDETEEEAKWKTRRLERERQLKKDDFSDSCLDVNVTSSGGIIKSDLLARGKGNAGCGEVSLSKLFPEANRSLKIAEPQRMLGGPGKKINNGGFLNMKGDVLQKIAEKVKVNVKDKEGSQTTKNFVFRAIDKPEDNSKVLKRPSSESVQSVSKRSKVEVVKPLPKRSNPRSIFSKF